MVRLLAHAPCLPFQHAAKAGPLSPVCALVARRRLSVAAAALLILLAITSLTGRVQGAATNTAAIGIISGIVYIDVQPDGSYGLGDEEVTGAVVAAYMDADGDGAFETQVRTTISLGQGEYTIDDLQPGLYLIRCIHPTGLATTDTLVEIREVGGVTSANLRLSQIHTLFFPDVVGPGED